MDTYGIYKHKKPTRFLVYQSVGRKGIHLRLNLKDGKKQESYTLPETNIAPENGWLEY